MSRFPKIIKKIGQIYFLFLLITASVHAETAEQNPRLSLVTKTCSTFLNPLEELNLINYVNSYSDFVPGISQLISFGDRPELKDCGTGYCYRAVKNYLLQSGVLRKRLDGTFAVSAHSKGFLKKSGFINLLDYPPYNNLIKGALDHNIPEGSIMVYSGSNGRNGELRPNGQGIGHIEIKCGMQCYLYDSISDYPAAGTIKYAGFFSGGVLENTRTLVGVYILDYYSLF